MTNTIESLPMLLREIAEHIEAGHVLETYYEIQNPCGGFKDNGGPLMYGLKSIRRKQRTIRIGGIDVPEPARHPLAPGQQYWAVLMRESVPYHWCGDSLDIRLLRMGMVHLTKDAAAAHRKALATVSGGQIDD